MKIDAVYVITNHLSDFRRFSPIFLYLTIVFRDFQTNVKKWAFFGDFQTWWFLHLMIIMKKLDLAPSLQKSITFMNLDYGRRRGIQLDAGAFWGPLGGSPPSPHCDESMTNDCYVRVTPCSVCWSALGSLNEDEKILFPINFDRLPFHCLL